MECKELTEIALELTTYVTNLIFCRCQFISHELANIVSTQLCAHWLLVTLYIQQNME